MLKWVPYPFLRITPAFMVGILTAYYTDFHVSLWLFGALLLAYILLVVCTPRQYLFYVSLPAGLLGLLLIFLAGFIIISEKQENNTSHHIANIQEEYDYYTATVVEPPQHRDKVFRTVVSVNQFIRTDSLHSAPGIAFVKGKVILYQPEEDSLKLVEYGDQLLIRGKPQAVQPPANPHEFDYRQHLAIQNIYHQHYLLREDWKVYGHHPEWLLVGWANKFRNRCKKVILQNVPGEEAQAIVLALTLGIKDYLDDNIKTSYAATGAMHVLAVSGLHVGIIYLVLSFFLTPLLHIPHGCWLRAGICIAVLWAYAMLAGWSPSVLRAATMFTFIIIAQATRWQTNIFNTLAASAFFLLCYDPLLMMTVGFQLSYLAVAGIIYLHPRIYQWFELEHVLPDKIWDLTAVAMAAQFATLPVSLYYFHQFPVYFWLANLLVIPAAFIILSLGLFTMLSGLGLVAPAVSQLSGRVLDKIVTLVNQGIAIIEHLPAGTWQNISVSLSQVLLLYGLIIAILMLWHYRSFRYVVLIFICMFCFTLIQCYRFYRQNQQNSITFYSVDQQTNIDFTHGTMNFHLGEYNEKAQYHIAPNHIQAGLLSTFISNQAQSTEELAIKKWKNLRFCVWHGKRVVLIEQPFDEQNFISGKLKADILVVCNNAVKNFETLVDKFEFSLLVIDSSNTRYRAQRLMGEAGKAGISCHAASLQGALTIHISD